jgi:hypothetical protein
VLGCLNLAEEMLVPNLLERHAWLLGARFVGDLAREDHNRDAVFKAADHQSPFVVITDAVDPVSSRWKCFSRRDELVGDVDDDLIHGLTLGGKRQRSQPKKRTQNSHAMLSHHFSFVTFEMISITVVFRAVAVSAASDIV